MASSPPSAAEANRPSRRPNPTEAVSSDCRLCNATTSVRFVKRVLGKHDVEFQYCRDCDSMQTEEPYWLAESYGSETRPLDVNAATRAVTWQRLLHDAVRALKPDGNGKLIDWGAGDGLLVRLLRDVGVDAYYDDPLATNHYAIGFEVDQMQGSADIVTAFEVWEHLSKPAEEIANMLAGDPLVHIATTDLFTGQDKSWRYFNVLTGRHVFFYSPRAVEMIAADHGYRATTVADKRLFFYKPDVPAKVIQKIERVLTDRGSRLWAALFALKRKPSLAGADRDRLQEETEAAQAGPTAGTADG